MFRTYLISGLLVLALFAAAQYRGWSVFSINEDKTPPGIARGVYHK